MSGDLRAVLAVVDIYDSSGDYANPTALDIDRILAALAAADEPLTAGVPCVNGCQDGTVIYEDTELAGPCRACHGTGTARIVAMTEDVLRARLREWGEFAPGVEDRIVRALFGEATDE